MLWTSAQSSPKFGLYVLFGFAFCDPSTEPCISALYIHYGQMKTLNTDNTYVL